MSSMKPLYDNIKLNCTIVSDTHLDTENPTPWVPQYLLRQALSEAKSSKKTPDAFIVVGDTTSHGNDANWKLVRSCFADIKPAEHILLAVGNHDMWSDDGYDGAFECYKKYTELICGVRRSKPYFSQQINGISLIFLGSDSDAGCEASIGEKQLEWLRGEMKKAAESGEPIFVFCHQSLNQKHGLPLTWEKEEKERPLNDGGVGEKSDEIESILKQYNNVWYISGHSHMGLCGENCKRQNGYSSFEEDGGLHLVNLPSLCCRNHHGETSAVGMGVQLEVYADRVLFRPRRFFTRSWNKKIIIKDSKPYYEQKL